MFTNHLGMHKKNLCKFRRMILSATNWMWVDNVHEVLMGYIYLIHPIKLGKLVIDCIL